MPNTSPATNNALSALHDIHAPTAIGWWPLAPGWYLLMILLLGLIVGGYFFLKRFIINQGPRRQALNLLDKLQQQYQQNGQTSVYAAHLSELLKRLALMYFPRTQVASLQGEAWLEFLNQTSQGLDFNNVRDALLEAPYQATKQLDLKPLFLLTRQWIKQRRGRCLK